MGAIDFEVWKVGRYENIQQALKEAQEDATREYGHQEGYSGAINSCSSSIDATYTVKGNGSSDGWKGWKKQLRPQLQEALRTFQIDKGDVWMIEVQNKAVKRWNIRQVLQVKRVTRKMMQEVKVFMFVGSAPC